ncbi:MAG: MFS transporter [Bacteroidales bacterium]|nr:MFS transporter [Bacteroidales bacterium]MCF8454717.1 MFS transporter [Bacteroidales bacterium]
MNAIKQSLRDSKKARWTALIILSFTMFAGYMFNEIISPLKPLIDADPSFGWDGSDFGMFFSAYGWFNVFFLMLLVVGFLLDKFGIRFSTISSAAIMVIGAAIKYYAFKTDMGDAQIFGFGARLMTACFGYALFGVGVEYAGITVSKAVVKWFKGKEMAMAMGMQVAIARLGSFVPLMFGAYFATITSIPTTVFMGVLILIIGFIGFLVYNIMDVKLDKEDKAAAANDEPEELFKLSDLKVIISNRGFWLIAVLCVLFYSAVFPFYKYGPDLMVNKFGVSDKWAGLIPSIVPFGTIFLTPFFGGIYDKKGKGATIMIIGAALLVVVHVIYWLPSITNMYLAFANAILLGIGFSLVPSAMWPSVPKIIPEKQIGSAFAIIFWIQNFGLWGIPLLVGIVLKNTNPGIAQQIKEGSDVVYDYETTWLIFIACTVLALGIAFWLKYEDKRKGYGLEMPNIQK